MEHISSAPLWATTSEDKPFLPHRRQQRSSRHNQTAGKLSPIAPFSRPVDGHLTYQII